MKKMISKGLIIFLLVNLFLPMGLYANKAYADTNSYVNLLGTYGNFKTDSNGDGFADGVNSNGQLTGSVANGVQTLNAIGTSNIEHYIDIGLPGTSLVAGHKYYTACKVKVTKGGVRFEMWNLTGASQWNDHFSIVGSANATSFEKLSSILTLSSVYSSPWAALRVKVCNTSASDWFIANGESVQVKDVIAIDLTATYGAGNEPSQVWCDANIGVSSQSYINMLGTYGDFKTDSNGDGFADGLVNQSAGSGSVSNGIQTFTATAQYGEIKFTGLSFIASHKYYISAYCKSTGTGNISFAFNDGSWFIDSNKGITGDWVHHSLVSTAQNTTSGGWGNVNDQRTSGWTPIQVKGCYLIDLTATFGVGYEPTQAWCDANINMQSTPNGNLLGRYGNFEIDSNGDGVPDGWVIDSPANFSSDISTKIIKIHGTGTGENTIHNDSISVVAGHKYYGKVSFMRQGNLSSPSGAQFDVIGTGITPEMDFSPGITQSLLPNTGVWYNFSNIVTAPATRSSATCRIFSFHPEWLYAKGMYLVDLTATYGAGKEPTLAWCDANIAGVPVGQDSTQGYPINGDMETTAEAAFINSQVSTMQGSAALTEDCQSGKYAVEVKVNSSNYVQYALTNSISFNSKQYGAIKLYVKPKSGADWIKFYVNSSGKPVLIMSDNDKDGVFKVGSDLISGQWNEVTLKLADAESLISDVSGLTVQTDNSSTWCFDNIKALNTNVYNMDLSKLDNDKTVMNNGKLQFMTSTNGFDTTPTVLTSNTTLPIQEGKINNIKIDRTYINPSGGVVNPLPAKYTVNNAAPTYFGVSGDGTKVIYGNPSDSNSLYKLDLITGILTKLTTVAPTNNILVNYDGTVAVFENGDGLYKYSQGSNSVVLLSNSSYLYGYAIQNDGDIFYRKTSSGERYIIKYDKNNNFSYHIHDSQLSTGFSLSKEKDVIAYVKDTTNKNQLVISGTDGITASAEINGVWVNPDGTKAYYLSDSKYYEYDLDTKITRQISLPSGGELIYGDIFCNASSKYDTITDQITKFTVPNEGTISNYCYDYYGNKMVFVSGGLKTFYPDGVDSIDKYLLSFDGRNSWYTCKDGTWNLVKIGSTPTADELKEYGMTADEVNNLSEADFNKLYEDGKEIYSFDISVYLASPDFSITPSINSITVSTDAGQDIYSTGESFKALYASKKQDFNASGWRAINKIYPVEITPKASDIYYFAYVNGQYMSMKGDTWTSVGDTLSSLETNWIDITQKGLTASELRSITSDTLKNNLLTNNTNKTFSIVYCMKVYDESTEQYKANIYADYTQDLFQSANLTLNITYNDGTVKQYSGLTDTQVEDFMTWVLGRQYNKGPIFYQIKVGNNNDFINYYMIQNVKVTEN